MPPVFMRLLARIWRRFGQTDGDSYVLVHVVALARALWTRCRPGKMPKGMGQRVIQFVGLAWLIGETHITHRWSGGTTLAAVAGYLFGMGRFDTSTQKGRPGRADG